MFLVLESIHNVAHVSTPYIIGALQNYSMMTMMRIMMMMRWKDMEDLQTRDPQSSAHEQERRKRQHEKRKQEYQLAKVRHESIHAKSRDAPDVIFYYLFGT